MNAARCTATDYVDFLVATPRIVSCVEAARVQPQEPHAPAHDAFTRLLHRLEPDPAGLWAEVSLLVTRARGVLIVDDSTLDKPYARKMELVHRHWSGKHHAVVDGINLITLLWTDGDRLIPVDYRVYDKPRDGITKNEHFLAMLLTARERGFTPECVLFDSWYASIDNLRVIRQCGWRWLTRLKTNRRVSMDYQPKRALETWPIAETGSEVHLEGYGLIRVFRVVATNGDAAQRAPDYWATNDAAMEELERLKYAEMAWGIEVYHRALKQECGVERAHTAQRAPGAARAQRNHPTRKRVPGHGDSGVCALGMAPGAHGDFLEDGEGRDHPSGVAHLSRKPLVYPSRYCVSRKH